MDWHGLSVTIPHKENALAYVGEANCEELARRIGAINTIVFDADGTLKGYNTDYAAAIDALCEAMGISREQLAGTTVAVLGAGGAARAIVAALVHYRAAVTIHNRTLDRAIRLAEEFSCSAAKLDAAAAGEAEIIVNCTSVGMRPNVNDSPLRAVPASAKVVFDTIYNPVETRLLRQAGAAGRRAVSGLEMFLRQAVRQFEIWTARTAPIDAMRKVLSRPDEPLA